MTENIRQLSNILLNAVKLTGEQVAEIMRKDLLRVDARFLAQCFHLPPDIRAAYRLAGTSRENFTEFDLLLRRVAEQFLS